ncbi:hypothetical protein H744_2c0073 [Photobacterium gaetbulicola Gung47]|uniref:Uncharacterized protein n=1 Tax=Photobacterium gaetbulicola Gung47 TaxID=658445 RepID=A0A0C5WUW6_9GAMM|nr:hypothetical protein H744_2c0073 [Photobacterium gaetbulicola Gung47]
MTCLVKAPWNPTLRQRQNKRDTITLAILAVPPALAAAAIPSCHQIYEPFLPAETNHAAILPRGSLVWLFAKQLGYAAQPQDQHLGYGDRKRTDLINMIHAQRQHDQTIHAQSDSSTIREPGTQCRHQVHVDWLGCQSHFLALTVIFFESGQLLVAIGQLVEAIGQLNALEVHLKALGNPTVLRVDLGQCRLRSREVIDKDRALLANVRLDTHTEQQLQQGIAVLLGLGDIGQPQPSSDNLQISHTSFQRADAQHLNKGLLVGHSLGGITFQYQLQQVIHLVHQCMVIEARAVPLQHGEFRVVETPRLFITE